MMKNIFAFLKSRVFLINLGIAIVALPLLFWIIFAWIGHYTHHNEFVEVPNFKDLKVKQLDNVVADKNIGYEIIDSLWDPKLEKGIVIKQDPDPGSKVKEGRKVYLYVTASQPPKIMMPNLIGTDGHGSLSDRQAMNICESYGLKCSIHSVPDERRDLVVDQFYKGKHIEPGTLIEKGSSIVLNVGAGSDNSGQGFAVPNLIGMNFRAARGKMVDLGLEWFLLTDPGVKDTLNAFVYSQDPKPGRDRKLLQGATIDLRVTNDKAKVNNDSIKTP